ncbi:hypothetical protein J7E96_28360 [Streptomyces sp. ISL-96]|uniref:hypothetical protein n=1 Tax=Streptomyces sp. ISL-96 TaxID=2819191 RepID=UPI001BEACBB0|nr:hypothetical protein [Streptomyces sp. ISL-96]MBT2492354.1 hypothetical protein [Streptomyces sp. ISL-96]
MAEEEALEEEARRVIDALEALEQMEDPAAQARAISRVLRDQPARTKKLKQIRQDYVRQQRAAKVSYRKIAQALGVSAGTVQDIERGYSGSGRDRKRKLGEQQGAPDEPPA